MNRERRKANANSHGYYHVINLNIFENIILLFYNKFKIFRKNISSILYA